MSTISEYFFIMLYYIGFFGFFGAIGSLLMKNKKWNQFLNYILEEGDQ